MEKKNSNLKILLIIFVVISLLLGGFIVYDKLLKKEGASCPKTDCQCEKTENKEKNDDDLTYILSSKYVNAEDNKSYIIFDTEDGTWISQNNVCEGYASIRGTYKIEGNKVILQATTFYNDADLVFVMSSNDSKNVDMLTEEEGEYSFSGCSGSNKFNVEK